MINITGLDQLQRELDDAQRALSNLEEDFGSVTFDPQDPLSIETAIQSINNLIDEKLGEFATNPLVSQLADSMKEAYRDAILQKAAEARLQADEDL